MNPITLGLDGRLNPSRHVGDASALQCLGSQIILEDRYTLRNYFRLIDRNEDLQSLNAFLPGFLEKYRGCPKRGCSRDDFDTLEFNKTVEMVGFPGKPRMEIYTSMHTVKNDAACSVGALSLETILDMPFRLGKLKHIVFGDKVDVFEFETAFGLFEFVDGVAWELSFQNQPAECAVRR